MPFDPAVVSRVRHLHLTARAATHALRMGNHRSVRVGQAVEFADHQAYLPGMDLRRLDWKVRARTDRWVVRRDHTETELPCHLVVDLSADLDTGTTSAHSYPLLQGTKAGYTLTLAATLAVWLIRQGEPVGLSLVAGEGSAVRELPPRGGERHLQALLHALATARPSGTAGLATALRQVAGRARRRGLVAVLTDGMEPPEDWVPALASFSGGRADLRLLHVYDRKELRLDFDEAGVFVGPEDGSRLTVDPAAMRAAFTEVVGEYLESVRAGVVRAGGQYVGAPTDRALDAVVRSLVTARTAALAMP